MALTSPELPFGVPGNAWQPFVSNGVPGEMFLGPNSLPVPDVPAQFMQPALNSGPTPIAQLPPGQQPLAALNPAPTAQPMGSGPRSAPNMFGSRAGQRVGTGPVPGMNQLQGRGIPKPFAQMQAQVAAQSIRPTPAMQGAGQVGGKLATGMPSAGPMSGYAGVPGSAQTGMMAPPPPPPPAGGRGEEGKKGVRKAHPRPLPQARGAIQTYCS
jgi:hypothetical protein